MSGHHTTAVNPIMTSPDLIDRYRFYLANARGLADNTVQAYAGDVRRFLDWMDATGADVDDMRPLLLGDYVYHLSKAGKRRSTLKRNVAAVRSFYRFLTSVDGRFRKSPVPDACDYPMNMEDRKPRWIGLAEATRLMEAANDATPCGLRDRALLEMMYASGVRLAEAHGMNHAHVDRLNGDVLVRRQGRQRTGSALRRRRRPRPAPLPRAWPTGAPRRSRAARPVAQPLRRPAVPPVDQRRR